MKHPSILALSAVLGLAAPGFALAATCERPAAPAAIDGATVTMDQLRAAKTGVTDFMTASDTYQGCLVDDLAAQRAAAKAAKTSFDASVAKAVEAKINENQADKERVGAEFNAAVKAFKTAHPS
jgi:hypothetical protein